MIYNYKEKKEMYKLVLEYIKLYESSIIKNDWILFF